MDHKKIHLFVQNVPKNLILFIFMKEEEHKNFLLHYYK